MIFIAHVIDAMPDWLNTAGPVLAGLLVRNVGLITLIALIWAMIVEAIVARTTEPSGFIVDHATVFLARVFACVIVAGADHAKDWPKFSGRHYATEQKPPPM